MTDVIYGVALLTLKKIKEPAFIMMLAIAVLLGYAISEMDSLSQQLSGNIMSQLINAKRGETLLTGSLFAFSIAVLIAIFAGATDIPRDISSGMIMIIMSKPVKKTEYLIGKYIGILILCLIFFCFIEVALILGHLFKTGELYSLSMIIRQFLLIFALFPLVGLNITISCFLGDFPAMIIAAIYLIFSVFVSTIPLLVEMLPVNIGITSYLFFIYYFFPNFIYYFRGFDLIGLISFGMVIYSLSLTTIFLLIATYRMEQRDLI